METDPRLVEIAKHRQLYILQRQNAELSYRVAELELEKLAAEEQKIKAKGKAKVR